MKDNVLVLAYAGCSTCRKALGWLRERGITPTVRAIVEEPPTPTELEAWIALSNLPIRKWLNTSGQSYRALGKEKVASATDAELARYLTSDGKLVKRPILVSGTPARAVLVGFNADAYAAAFPRR